MRSLSKPSWACSVDRREEPSAGRPPGPVSGARQAWPPPPGTLCSFQYDRKPHFQKEGIKRREREGQKHQARCFLILKASSLTVGPELTREVLVSGSAESACLGRVFPSWPPVLSVVAWHTPSAVLLATFLPLATDMLVRCLSGLSRRWHASECYQHVRKSSLRRGGKVMPWT